jgi:hypothetical protein
MKLRTLDINLSLSGEGKFFLEMVKQETNMEYSEIFAKMIDLYKQVYLNDRELAWIEGDVIVKKLSSEALKTRRDG